MEREKYFVNLQDQAISKEEIYENHGLTIHATLEEVELLRKLFHRLHSSDFGTFLRSMVPIKPYHKAESDTDFDESYAEVAKMLYYLGDDQTKKFIRESGVIGDKPMDTDYTYPDPEHDGGKEA